VNARDDSRSILAGLSARTTAPTAGAILIGGRPVSGPRPETVSLVFQDSNLLPWRSILRNVTLALETVGVPKSERIERAHAALRLVQSDHVANSYPHELSGGMRHRVSLARGFVTEPSVLLMDEPFAALDEQTRVELGGELLDLWGRQQTTIIFVTHNLAEALLLSDEVVCVVGAPGLIRDQFEVPFARPRAADIVRSDEFDAARRRLERSGRLGPQEIESRVADSWTGSPFVASQPSPSSCWRRRGCRGT
jgi:NitT/TauT family transport system ATP-binding protein